MWNLIIFSVLIDLWTICYTKEFVNPTKRFLDTSNLPFKVKGVKIVLCIPTGKENVVQLIPQIQIKNRIPVEELTTVLNVKHQKNRKSKVEQNRLNIKLKRRFELVQPDFAY